MIYKDSTPAASFLAPADTAIIISPNNFWPTSAGDYHVVYYASFNGSDVDSSNNYYFTDTLSITDSTFARDNGIASGQLGIGTGVRGEIGSIFSIDRADSLTSVSIYITNAGGVMTGQPISVNIRSFGTLPTSVIASSDTITYSSTGASWVDFSFKNAGGFVPLSQGRFFVGVREPDSNLTLGTSASSITPNVNFVNFPNNPQNGWGTLDVYNIFTCLMIRPSFGPTSILVSLAEDNLSTPTELNIYPNPSSSGVFMLQFGSNSAYKKEANFKVFDMSGAAVPFKLSNLNNEGGSLDLSTQSPGIYFLLLDDGKERKIKKLIIN